MKYVVPFALVLFALAVLVGVRDVRQRAAEPDVRAIDASAFPVVRIAPVRVPLAADAGGARDFAPVRDATGTDAAAAVGGGARLWIRVVDAGGARIPGVAVVLRERESDVLDCAVTDADGEASIPYVPEEVANVEWVAGFRGPFHSRHDVPIGLDPPSDEPVELRWPATAALEVVARDVEGEPLRGARIALVRYGRELHPMWPVMEEAVGVTAVGAPDGVALFPCVEAGIAVRVLVDHPDCAFAGHATTPPAGSTARIEIAPDPGDVTVRGRLVAVDGRPIDVWGSMQIMRFVEGPTSPPARARMRIHDDGRFMVRVPREHAVAAGRAEGWFVFGGFSSILCVPIGAIDGSSIDLGDVPVDRDHALGVTLRDVDGAPVPGAWGRVLVSPRAGLPFTEFPLPRWSSDRDGHVRLPISHAPEARWRLTPDGDLVVVGPEWITGDGFTVIVERRARNLPVRPSAVVSGRVLLDEWDDADPLLATMLAVDLFAGGELVQYHFLAHDGTFAVPVSGEQRFDVAIRPTWRVGATAIVRDVPVDESFEIDLRDEFTLVRLSGIDARGARVPIQVRALGEPMSPDVSGLESGVVLALDRRSRDVVVSSPGYRDVILRGLARDEVVDFVERAFPLEIVWSEFPGLPADVRLEVVIRHEETVDPHDPWRVGTAPAAWTPSGIASVLASAIGPHRVGLVASRPWHHAGGGACLLTLEDSPVIEVSEGPATYVVRFDPRRVEALIEAARR